MRVALGGVHVGFALKRDLADVLTQEGYEVLDLRTGMHRMIQRLVWK